MLAQHCQFPKGTTQLYGFCSLYFEMCESSGLSSDVGCLFGAQLTSLGFG